MKKVSTGFIVTVVFFTLGALSALANDLETLAGKWTAERKDDQDRTYKQVFEIKKDKFTFTVNRDGDQTVLYAEGEVKAEQLGPFKALKLFNIQGGRSASNLQPVEDDRTLIYTLGNNEMTVAANFDKTRSEPATLTKYTKLAATEEPRTLVIDKIVMHKTPQSAKWFLCFNATVVQITRRFHVPDKTYEKDELTIVTDLAIPGVRNGQTCKFVMKLDDVAGDECSEEMDNRSAGEFKITESGSQDFKPEDQWTYALYWHLK